MLNPIFACTYCNGILPEEPNAYLAYGEVTLPIYICPICQHQTTILEEQPC